MTRKHRRELRKVYGNDTIGIGRDVCELLEALDAAEAALRRHEEGLANEPPCAHRVEAERLEKRVAELARDYSEMTRDRDMLVDDCGILRGRVAELEVELYAAREESEIRGKQHDNLRDLRLRDEEHWKKRVTELEEALRMLMSVAREHHAPSHDMRVAAEALKGGK